MANIITFPKLGFSLNLSPVAFTVGTKEVYWYALIILFGFLMGIFLVSFDSEKRGLSKDNVLDIALWGMVSGVICARIYYVLFSLDEFRGDWLGIFRIWEGGIAIYGAIIGAVLSTFIYCKKKKLNIFNTFDVCCIGLLLGQAIGRWGNFTNCEVFGRPTDFFLGMSINGNTPVHPLFFYESMWSFAGVILLAILRNKKKKNGQIFFEYVLWYSVGRLVLEGMRDTRYILYVIPDVLGISQLVAALLIILSVAGIIYVTKSDKDCFKLQEN